MWIDPTCQVIFCFVFHRAWFHIWFILPYILLYILIFPSNISSKKYFAYNPSFLIYLMRYWHIGSKRNAKATVAITAVHIANNICIESKKKNMTSSDIEAPNGRHIACIESRVCIPLAFDSFPPDDESESPSSFDSSSPNSKIQKSIRSTKCYLIKQKV